jgi:type I restriction enzyme S subunit
MSVPDGWSATRIGGVCEINPLLRPEDKPDPDMPVSFLPMSGVDEVQGRVTAVEIHRYAEVVRYNHFLPGDVLFAKITPSMENGKSAIVRVLETRFGFCSTELFVLRPRPGLLPEYLWFFLRQASFRRRAAVAFVGSVGQQRVPLKFLARVKFPLPSLPEQRRITDILRQAESCSPSHTKSRGDLDDVLGRVLETRVLGRSKIGKEVLGRLVETQHGTSALADAHEGNGIPVLRIPNVVGGEVDERNLKYVILPANEIERLRLAYGDVLVVRSNGNPNYVGRSAPVTHDLAARCFAYASYLIRLRSTTARLLPEYLSGFLNSPMGRASMRNAIRTTAGVNNLSAESLSGVEIPLPSLEKQQLFARVWREAREVRKKMTVADAQATEVRENLQIQAFSGELTESWREAHRAEIAHEKQSDVASARTMVQFTESAPLENEPLKHRPAREWILDELSLFQQGVLRAVRAWRGTLVPDDADLLDDFCRQWPIEHESHSKDRVRRTLDQLAALGLITKVSLPNAQGNYLAGYRPLRPDDATRLTDVETLRALLEAHGGSL